MSRCWNVATRQGLHLFSACRSSKRIARCILKHPAKTSKRSSYTAFVLPLKAQTRIESRLRKRLTFRRDFLALESEMWRSCTLWSLAIQPNGGNRVQNRYERVRVHSKMRLISLEPRCQESGALCDLYVKRHRRYMHDRRSITTHVACRFSNAGIFTNEPVCMSTWV